MAYIQNIQEVIDSVVKDEDLLRTVLDRTTGTSSKHKGYYNCTCCSDGKGKVGVFITADGTAMWKCLICGTSGTVIQQIIGSENAENTPGAVEHLSEHYNIPVQVQVDSAFVKMDNYIKTISCFTEGYEYLRHHYYRDTDNQIVSVKILFKNEETGKKRGLIYPVEGTRVILKPDRSKPQKPILYNTNLIKHDTKTVCITEGEKDANTLTNLGFTAVAARESSSWTEEYTRQLAHVEHIYIFTDNDDTGKKYAALIVDALKGVSGPYNLTRSIKVVNIPVRIQKGDITDYVEVMKKQGLNRNDIILSIKQMIRRSENILSPFEIHQNRFGYFRWEKIKGTEGEFQHRQITDFTMSVEEAVECIDDPDGDYHTIIITHCSTGTKEVRQFMPDSMNNVDIFKKTLRSLYTTFTGKQGDIDDIKKYVFNGNYPVHKIVSCCGLREINDTWYYIEKDKCLKGNVICDDYTANPMKESTMLLSNILESDPIKSTELDELRNHLFKFNAEKISYSLVGYAIACLFKQRLKKLGYSFPHLINIGEAGSGKSQTTKLILGGLFGTDKYDQADNITKYSIDNFTESNNTVPLILDEYKPYMMAKWRIELISSVMRSTYDNLSSSRGTGKGTIKTRTPRASVVLIGEAGTNETAIIERSVMLSMSKFLSIRPAQTASFKWLKKNKHLLTKLSRVFLPHTMLMDDATIETFYETALEAIDPGVTTHRIREALAVNLFGIMILNTLMKDIDLDYVANMISQNSIEEVGNESKGIVELTLEEIDAAMSVIMSTTVETHSLFTLVNKGTELALRINAIYPEFTKYIRTYNTGFGALTEKEFVKLLKKTKYYVGYKQVVFQTENDTDSALSIDEFVNGPIRKKAFILKVEELKDLDLESMIDSNEEHEEIEED